MENYTMQILNVSGKENQVVEGIEKIEADAITAALMENHNVDVQKMVDKFKRGKKIMYPFRYERWAKQVGAYEGGDRNGIETTIALNIMEKIENKVPVEKIVAYFESADCCSTVNEAVRNMVMKLSKNGFPFYAATHYGEWTLNECDWIVKYMEENQRYDGESEMAKEASESLETLSEKQKALLKQRKINNQ